MPDSFQPTIDLGGPKFTLKQASFVRFLPSVLYADNDAVNGIVGN